MNLVIISKVKLGMAGDTAGLKVGDSILQYGGHNVSHTDDIIKLGEKITAPVIDVKLMRNNQVLVIRIQPKNWGISFKSQTNTVHYSSGEKSSNRQHNQNRQFKGYKLSSNEFPEFEKVEPQKDKSLQNIFLTAVVFLLAFIIFLIINQMSFGGCFKGYCIEAATPKVAFGAAIVSVLFYVSRTR